MAVDSYGHAFETGCGGPAAADRGAAGLRGGGLGRARTARGRGRRRRGDRAAALGPGASRCAVGRARGAARHSPSGGPPRRTSTPRADLVIDAIAMLQRLAGRLPVLGPDGERLAHALKEWFAPGSALTFEAALGVARTARRAHWRLVR